MACRYPLARKSGPSEHIRTPSDSVDSSGQALQDASSTRRERVTAFVADGQSEVLELADVRFQPVPLDLEAELVRQALQRTTSNPTKAAKLLGLSRDQLRYRMEKLGLLHSNAKP